MTRQVDLVILLLCNCGLLLLLSQPGRSTKPGSDSNVRPDQIITLEEDPQCIHIEELPRIRLSEGQETNARRYSPAPQLKRVGGSASSSAPVPSVIECRNTGYNGYKIFWDCSFKDYEESNLYKLGYFEVICEACTDYGYPQEKRVLRNSCRMEYLLNNLNDSITISDVLWIIAKIGGTVAICALVVLGIIYLCQPQSDVLWMIAKIGGTVAICALVILGIIYLCQPQR